MLCFLGLRVAQPLTNSQKYKEALQEIRHYISFKQGIHLSESEYVLTVGRGLYTLQLPKNLFYLHSCHYNFPLLHEDDFSLLDVCYECLLIIREAFPSKVPPFQAGGHRDSH